ncbi:MAG: guanylate kinase [Bacteroidales bacterium]|nr:guanylate kinase [Bacteroidales bacterium]
MTDRKGKLIVFSAPSGAGKTTIVKALLTRIPELEFSVSACSRPMREGEVHSKDYYFLSAEEFRQKIQREEFLEWEEVYDDRFYGTLKTELQRIWDKNHHVLFDVDVKGGINIKQQYPANTLSVFVMPPSLEVLSERLINRGTEVETELKKRLGKAEFEMTFAPQFDLQIINDDLESAINQAEKEVRRFISR